MSLLRRVFDTSATEVRGTESLADMIASERGGPVAAGVPVTPTSALRLNAVYACVRVIADAVAGLPIHAYRPTEGGGREMLPTQPRLIADPWPEISRYDWAFQSLSSVLLTGNTNWIAAERDRRGVPSMLMPVHPDAVSFRRLPSGRLEWKVNGNVVAAGDMVHVPGFTVPGNPLGLSPIMQAKQAIGIGIAAERFGGQWFGDSSAPSAVFETDESVSPEDRARTLASWQVSHAGNRHPAMLTGGLKYRQITITPDESQFLQTQKFTVTGIARLFGVPPHMIADLEKSSSWGTGIEQQSIAFVQYTLQPWLARFEAALSKLLPGSQYVRFNVDGLLRGDTKTRFDSYVKARNAGWLNVNEIRAFEDMPSIGTAGDQYIQPLNMGPIGSDPTSGEPTP